MNAHLEINSCAFLHKRQIKDLNVNVNVKAAPPQREAALSLPLHAATFCASDRPVG